MPKRISKKRSYGKKRKSYGRFSKSGHNSPSTGAKRVSPGTYVQSTRTVSKVLSRFGQWNAFPPSISGKMYYVQQFALTGGVVGITGLEQVMRLNSLFDPDFTGGGHQPNTFDQVAALYGTYRVTKCDIELEWFNSNENGAYCLWMISGPLDPLTTQSISPGQILERPNCDYCLVNAASSGSNSIQRVKFSVNIADVMGMTRQQVENDVYDWCAPMTASPSQQVYMRLNIASSGATSTLAVGCNVKMMYHYTAWDRKTQGQS